MLNSARKNVRMGTGISTTQLVLFGAGGAAVVAGVLALLLSGSDDAPRENVGCKKDADCSGGRFCAAGGCIYLLSSEHPGLWREDIATQLSPDAGTAWESHPTAGEPLPKVPRCIPATAQKIDTPSEKKTFTLARNDVHVINPSETKRYVQRRLKATVWINAIRLDFHEEEVATADRACLSKNVSAVQFGTRKKRGGKLPYCALSLHEVAPANAQVSAAVEFSQPARPPDENDVSTYSLTLAPVYGTQTKHFSIAIFPLGTEIVSLGGPPPTIQRLFNGYFAYYWRHNLETSTATIRFRYRKSKDVKVEYAKLHPA